MKPSFEILFSIIGTTEQGAEFGLLCGDIESGLTKHESKSKITYRFDQLGIDISFSKLTKKCFMTTFFYETEAIFLDERKPYACSVLAGINCLDSAESAKEKLNALEIQVIKYSELLSNSNCDDCVVGNPTLVLKYDLNLGSSITHQLHLHFNTATGRLKHFTVAVPSYL